MLGYLSTDIICSEKRTVFQERSTRKTVNFEEQIMSKDKYPRIFSQPNWGYCVYYPLVLKIGEYPREYSVTRLDQSHASENIWWIIKYIHLWASNRAKLQKSIIFQLFIVMDKVVFGTIFSTGVVNTKTIIIIIHRDVRESGGYLPHSFAAWQISTTIHLHLSK